MKNITLFDTHSEYETYINGTPTLPNVSYCNDNMHSHYTPKPHDYSKDYFTIKSLNDDMKIYFGSNNDLGSSINLSYSVDDGNTWTVANTSSMNWGDQIQLTTINTGEKVLFKGINTTFGDQDGYSAHLFAYRDDYGSGLSVYGIEVEGNIMSMFYGDNFQDKTSFPTNTFNQLSYFCASTTVVYAHNLILPATTLTQACYERMFDYCTRLLTAPKLPATTLAQSCYDSMFNNCTSLTTAPELPTIELSSACYRAMFYNCSSLNYIKAMFTTQDQYNSGTAAWVYGVSATGTFIKNSAAQWNITGENGIPSGWTVQTASS